MSDKNSRKVSRFDLAKLKHAFRTNDVQSIKKFLEQGWDPSERIDGENPLTFCANEELAGLLMNAGADAHTGKNNWTPLLMHSGFGHAAIVDRLIRMGVDVNAAYSRRGMPQIAFGMTALINAAGQGHLGIVKRLLAAGAEINVIDEYGHNALFHALLSNKLDMSKELLRRGSELSADALCPPVFYGNNELVTLLIAEGANVNCVFRNDSGDTKWPTDKTLLGYAIAHVGIQDYPIEIVEALVKAGADVNQPSNWFRITKTKKGFVGTVKPTPPLRIAGSRGLEDVMNLLWKYGAKTTLQEAMADCTLERAAYRNDAGVVRLLIKAGVCVNAVGDETGRRPIEIARDKGHTEIVELLERAGAK